jgi:hypothetical protein
MGREEAIINGQPFHFEDASPPTVAELRQQGHIPANQDVVWDKGNGATETLSDDAKIQAGEHVVSIPRYILG